MQPGCYTALITPFKAGGGVDYESLQQLVDFQVAQGISGVLAVGTTGESPVLSWSEHLAVVDAVIKQADHRCAVIAGAGSNNTVEALKAVRHAAGAGADAVLVVDPYYNGPSSLELRHAYYKPIAAAVPELEIIPYIIPGRTGTQLFPADLALLAKEARNVTAVKEATGNLDNMRLTRRCCGSDFTIFSGDDALTFEMMTDPKIAAAGVISVASNLAPAPICRLARLIRDGAVEEARQLNKALEPLFALVTVTTTEQTPYGPVKCRARNPLALKILMAMLGLPSGGCRPPLDKMSRQGLERVIEIGKTVLKNNPEFLTPVADFFNLDFEQRLNSEIDLASFSYDGYN